MVVHQVLHVFESVPPCKVVAQDGRDECDHGGKNDLFEHDIVVSQDDALTNGIVFGVLLSRAKGIESQRVDLFAAFERIAMRLTSLALVGDR